MRFYSDGEESLKEICSELRCCKCDYILKGLASSARCPECGEPIHTSVETQTFTFNHLHSDRRYLAWAVAGFFMNVLAIVLTELAVIHPYFGRAALLGGFTIELSVFILIVVQYTFVRRMRGRTMLLIALAVSILSLASCLGLATLMIIIES